MHGFIFESKIAQLFSNIQRKRNIQIYTNTFRRLAKEITGPFMKLEFFFDVIVNQ